MSDMDPKLCAQVYVDLEYRKKWDTFVLGMRIKLWWEVMGSMQWTPSTLESVLNRRVA